MIILSIRFTADIDYNLFSISLLLLCHLIAVASVDSLCFIRISSSVIFISGFILSAWGNYNDHI